MSASDTNCPAVTASPLRSEERRVGKDGICTGRRALAGTTPGSLNPKSPAVNVYEPSSSTVTVWLVPCGASLTHVTLTVIVRGVESRLAPPLAAPPSPSSWNLKLAYAAPLWPATGV